jgi:hypothetical protein
MSRGRSIYYYGTREDCGPVFDELGQSIPVKYVNEASRVDSIFEVHSSPLGFENFGESRWKNGGSLSLIILPECENVPFEYWPERQVPEKYGFFTPKTDCSHVYFKAGGFYRETGVIIGLLEGWISTNSTNPKSLAIFEALKKNMRKKWTRVKGAYLGPEALTYLRSGGRLSQDLTRPVLYDLQEDAPAS